MELEVSYFEKVTVLKMGGDIQVIDEGQFRMALLNMMKEGRTSIVLDFEGAEYICSSCMGVLVMVLNRLNARDGHLKLANLGSKIMKFFEVTRLTEMLDIYDSVDEALKAFPTD